MATLYRKYRPQTFSELIGQNHIKTTISQEIASDKMAHAYLFSGPRAVGKTTLARLIAKAINCEKRKDGEYEPCNECNSCKDIIAGKGIDIMEIDAASHTGVDNVRENIIAVSRTATTNAKFRVFIIDEAHMLSTPAFNALLKVLEEPPAGVIFILCTTEIHKFPATIISRCQRFDFRRINIADISHQLNLVCTKEKVKIDKKVLDAIARQSEGHMRDALSLLGQVIAIGGKEITQEEADLVIPRSDINEVIKLIKALIDKNASIGIELINKALNDGIDLNKFTNDTIEILRKLMLVKINPALAERLAIDYGDNIEMEINKLVKASSVEKIIYYIEKFSQAKNDLKNSFITQLPLEMVISTICSSQTIPANMRPQQMNTPAKVIQTPPAVKQLAPNPTPTNNNVKESMSPQASMPQANTSQAPALENAVPLGDITIDNIRNKWHEVLARAKTQNHSLVFILKVCEPRDLKGNSVCLAFRYKFHKDRVEDVSIKQTVEQVMSDVYGHPIVITTMVDESIDTANMSAPAPAKQACQVNDANPKQNNDSSSENDDKLNNILESFGGRVVE